MSSVRLAFVGYAPSPSSYRARMMDLAKPLPQSVSDRLAFCRLLNGASQLFSQDSIKQRPLLTLEAYGVAKTIADFANEHGIAFSGQDPKAAQEGLLRSGVYFDNDPKNPIIAPLLDDRSFGTLRVFALMNPDSTSPIEGYHIDHSRSQNILHSYLTFDAIGCLRTAIEYVNFFRHRSAEPFGLLLASWAERGRPNVEQLIQERMAILLPKTGRFDLFSMWNLAQTLSSSAGEMLTAMRFLDLIRTRGILVNRFFAEDEIGHTIALANAFARAAVINSVMFHLQNSLILSQCGISPNDQKAIFAVVPNHNKITMIGWFADLAYGDSLVRLWALSEQSIRPESSSLGFLRPFSLFTFHATKSILSRCGFTPIYGLPLLGLSAIPEPDLKANAQVALDQFFTQFSGKRFTDIHWEFLGLLDSLNSYAPINRANLPNVLKLLEESEAVPEPRF
ncbi:hypothetical protein HY988_04805 [Candidatus Micrarchaeota archaeon]|nr:hypothetical protein [Candidatus Micrarchaeota archaeon]